jgi:RNA polymerase sigma-70 factor (ECF subfamily)
MPDQSTHLLVATRRGDESAARALWHLYAPRLTAYARSVVRSRGTPHDADDIVQVAFCRIMDLQDHELAAVRDVGPWLARITRNTALNWLRTLRRDAARRQQLQAYPPSRTPSATDPSIADAVDALPSRLREVVMLKHIAGLTFDQIELATGINRNTVAARYRTALSLLRESLDPACPKSFTHAASPRQDLVHHG